MRQVLTLALLLSLLTACEQASVTGPPATLNSPEGMILIPGGTYQRGNTISLENGSSYDEETPVHPVTVSPFYMDETEVTNEQFHEFVSATGYETIAERGFSAADFPNAPPEQLVPGAMIFTTPGEDVDPRRASLWQWWQFVPGASWKSFFTPETAQHPVTCVTYEDAQAYAKWADKRLPTEAEWERAARGGLEKKLFIWGDDMIPDGAWQANAFQGEFPAKNTLDDGFAGTAPVKSYAANPYGLYDMAGNVWEICSDYYSPLYYENLVNHPIDNPKGPQHPISQIELNAYLNTGKLPPSDQRKLLPYTALYSIKGGSFLCDADYCQRYRPAARFYTESLAPTNHTGFRCAKDLEH